MLRSFSSRADLAVICWRVALVSIDGQNVESAEPRIHRQEMQDDEREIYDRRHRRIM